MEHIAKTLTTLLFYYELVSKLFRLLLNAICMGFREFREVSDGEWEVIRPFLYDLKALVIDNGFEPFEVEGS